MSEGSGSTDFPSNEAVVRRFFEEVFNQGRTGVIDEIIAPDYVDYGHNPPGHGPQGALDDYQGVTAISTGTRFDIDDVVSAGDTIAVRWTGHLVHTGVIAGFEPTGNHLILSGMSFYKIHGGKISETRNQADMLGLMNQLQGASG
jgi:predicted ester cyclase